MGQGKAGMLFPFPRSPLKTEHGQEKTLGTASEIKLHTVRSVFRFLSLMHQSK